MAPHPFAMDPRHDPRRPGTCRPDSSPAPAPARMPPRARARGRRRWRRPPQGALAHDRLQHGLRRVLTLAEDAGGSRCSRRLRRTYRPEDDAEADWGLGRRVVAGGPRRVQGRRWMRSPPRPRAAPSPRRFPRSRPAVRRSARGSATSPRPRTRIRRAMDMLFKRRRARRDGLLVSEAEAPGTPRTTNCPRPRTTSRPRPLPPPDGRPAGIPSTLGPLPLPSASVIGARSGGGRRRRSPGLPERIRSRAACRRVHAALPRPAACVLPPEPASQAAARRASPIGSLQAGGSVEPGHGRHRTRRQPHRSTAARGARSWCSARSRGRRCRRPDAYAAARLRQRLGLLGPRARPAARRCSPWSRPCWARAMPATAIRSRRMQGLGPGRVYFLPRPLPDGDLAPAALPAAPLAAAGALGAACCCAGTACASTGSSAADRGL